MKNASIDRSSAYFSQAVIVLIAVGTFIFLLWEPHVEGVNAHATTLFEIYFDDPFLAFAYVASTPFFVALHQAFKLLGHAGRRELFSRSSARALRTIRWCAVVTMPCIAIGTVWLLSSESDDRPPILMMGAVTMLLSIMVAIAAAAFERKLRHVEASMSE